jgi:hypothetical protein
MARFRDLQKMYPECMRQLWALRPEMPAKNAPVAQLDRAPDYESGGQEFESLRARQHLSEITVFLSTVTDGASMEPVLGSNVEAETCNFLP